MRRDAYNSAYVLESDSEFARLERQSELPAYDFREELRDFGAPLGSLVLDAGCGSGVVSRYLAGLDPSFRVLGVDRSKERLSRAIERARGIENLRFESASLDSLPVGDRSAGAAVCRYVVEHLPKTVLREALLELYRVLRPGARAWIIDFDGLLLNLFPRSRLIDEVLHAVESRADFIDLAIGRKIPRFLHLAGFVDIQWRIQTIECHGETLGREIELWPAKLEAALGPVSTLLGSRERALEFNRRYVEEMSVPGATLFYNKFIVSAAKPPAPILITK